MDIANAAGAFLGGALAGCIVAWLTQRFIERRERRTRRDELRLELYLDVVDLILKDERALAEQGARGQIPPAELQTDRLRIRHRLELLASPPAREAYKSYHHLVFVETAHDLKDRPADPDEVTRARDRLIATMVDDVQDP